MTALYPLKITSKWSAAEIRGTIEQIAVDLGFGFDSEVVEMHEADAQGILKDLIQYHGLKNEAAIDRLWRQRHLLCEVYQQVDVRWVSEQGEIVLVLADENRIPFPAPDIKNTGAIEFACGWVDFVMPDRVIASFKLESRVQCLPLLYGSGSREKSTNKPRHGSGEGGRV